MSAREATYSPRSEFYLQVQIKTRGATRVDIRNPA
jgi:hypothetical protein